MSQNSSTDITESASTDQPLTKTSPDSDSPLQMVDELLLLRLIGAKLSELQALNKGYKVTLQTAKTDPSNERTVLAIIISHEKLDMGTVTTPDGELITIDKLYLKAIPE